MRPPGSLFAIGIPRKLGISEKASEKSLIQLPQPLLIQYTPKLPRSASEHIPAMT